MGDDSLKRTIADVGDDAALLRELSVALPKKLPSDWKPVPAPTPNAVAFHDGHQLRVVLFLEVREGDTYFVASIGCDNGRTPNAEQIEKVKHIFFSQSQSNDLLRQWEQAHQVLLERKL